MLRASVTSAFALTGRGTVITIRILEGSVKAGDVVFLALGSGTVAATVRSVEFVDYDVGRPSYRAEPALLIDGLAPSDAPVGTPVSS